MKAEQAVETTRATATADREKQIALIGASREAEQKAIAIKVAAEAEKEAADNRAAAVKIKAEADRVAFEVEATGKRADQRRHQRAVVGADQPADQARADPRAAGDHREVGRADEADRRHQDRAGRRSHARLCAGNGGRRRRRAERQPGRAGGRGGARLPRAVADHRRAAQGDRHDRRQPRRADAGRWRRARSKARCRTGSDPARDERASQSAAAEKILLRRDRRLGNELRQPFLPQLTFSR